MCIAMSKLNIDLHGFNAGEASAAALARVDQETIRLTAERQENLLPSVVGKAIMRPGTQYLSAAQVTPAQGDAIIIPFARSASETALIELSRSGSNAYMRAYVNDQLVSYPGVSCSITNGDFSGGATGWTDASTGTATLTFASNCSMQALSAGGRAILKRTITTSSPNTLHAIQIQTSGTQNITFRCGSTSGSFDYIGISSLPPGYHSLAFTPTVSSIYIQF